MGFSGSDTQYEGQAGGHRHEFGYLSFSTTGLTKTVTTRLTHILGFQAVQKVTTGALTERLLCGGTISTGLFTVTRELTPIQIGSYGNGPIASNDYVEVPIGIFPVAGVLTALYWYNGVKAGGSPLMEVGKVPTGGAGSANVDFFVDSADDAGNSHVQLASSTGKSIFALTDSGTYANGSRVVAALDLLTASTTGGTSSDPADLFISATILPTPTSGVTFWYDVWGY